jgi:DNA primase
MGGRIPSQFIDELLHRIDIVELIQSRITLKKSGANYLALCPFHTEKTPSFNVNPDKQFYHCFGCGASGTAIGFLMEHDNMGFVEAVEELAQRAGLEVPREGGYRQGPDHGDLIELLEKASATYQGWLRNHPQRQRAVDYLKQRGLSGVIAAEYQLGYVPPGWDNIKRALGGDDAKVADKLALCGLLTSKEDGHSYDRFRDRIIFPIRDTRGRTIGFGGRVMGDDKPKYLNSPETPLFHKGRELYGLYEARKAQRKLTSILVVEGYMDVIALAQFEVRNAVATLGTATSADHLEKMFRIVSEVVFCFDGDQAGRDAAWKALNTALPLMRDGREVRFLFLPEGEDPDSLIRAEGKEGLERRIGEALPLSEYFFRQLQQGIDPASVEGRSKIAQQAEPLIASIPQSVYRDLLQKRLNELVGLELSVMPASAPPPFAPRQRQRAPYRRGGRDLKLSLQRRAITILVQCPVVVAACAEGEEVSERWRLLDEPGVALLAELFDQLKSDPGCTTATLLEHWRDRPEYPALSKLAVAELDLSGDPDALAAEFVDALKQMGARHDKRERDRKLEEQLREMLAKRGSQ